MSILLIPPLNYLDSIFKCFFEYFIIFCIFSLFECEEKIGDLLLKLTFDLELFLVDNLEQDLKDS